MCVAAIAHFASPEWHLVAIGNRDEFHARPAAPLAKWENDDIIAGTDLQSGGTWLGLSQAEARFALVTNRRGFGDPDLGKNSRGKLVTSLLTGETTPARVPLDSYNSFNLLLVSGEALHFLTNRPGPLHTTLPHGVYGLSNGELDQPWPKTLLLKTTLTQWLQGQIHDPEALFDVLASRTGHQNGVPAQVPSDIGAEPRDTAPFIHDSVYGTRCSTVVMVNADGAGTIIERRFNKDGDHDGETLITFQWP